MDKLYYITSKEGRHSCARLETYLVKARNKEEAKEIVNKVFPESDGWIHNFIGVNDLEKDFYYLQSYNY